MTALQTLVSLIAQAIFFLMIIYIVMSLLISFNVINRHHPVVGQIWSGVSRAADYLLDPIRRYMPDTGGIDFSPMVLLILVQVIQSAFFGGLF